MYSFPEIGSKTTIYRLQQPIRSISISSKEKFMYY